MAAALPAAAADKQQKRDIEIANANQNKTKRISLFEKGLDLRSFTQPTGISIPEVRVVKVPSLSEYLPNLPHIPNTIVRTKVGETSQQKYNQEIDADENIILDLVRTKTEAATAVIRAGPRRSIVWQRGEVKAAIVTCGGLCPGLNTVIWEIVNMLYYNYGVDEIYGIRMGYRGFYDPQFLPFLRMTPQSVDGISARGGTVLGTSRGGFDADKIIAACVEHGINQVYVIGGDGSHRACGKLHAAAFSRKLKLSFIGVPKTIDNDIGIIDRSFGFDTAVEEAEKAIASAAVESRCTPNGIGIVKVMGRSSGFLAAHSALASRGVDLVLIPEVAFELDGKNGILPHIARALKRNGHCLIVLAEGAGTHLLPATAGTDPSGNKILPDNGAFLKQAINAYFKAQRVEVKIAYNDPSYMIRSVPANSADQVYCIILAQNAVHGAMAGYTGFTSALVNNRTCYLPVELIVQSSPTYLNPHGRTWERVFSSTHQPNPVRVSKL